MLTGEIKAILVEVLTPLVSEIQRRRSGVTDAVAAEFMRPRPLKVSPSPKRPSTPQLTPEQMTRLNERLSSRSYLRGFALSDADIAVRARVPEEQAPALPHLMRWSKHVREISSGQEAVRPAMVDEGEMERLMGELGQSSVS